MRTIARTPRRANPLRFNFQLQDTPPFAGAIVATNLADFEHHGIARAKLLNLFLADPAINEQFDRWMRATDVGVLACLVAERLDRAAQASGFIDRLQLRGGGPHDLSIRSNDERPLHLEVAVAIDALWDALDHHDPTPQLSDAAALVQTWKEVWPWMVWEIATMWQSWIRSHALGVHVHTIQQVRGVEGMDRPSPPARVAWESDPTTSIKESRDRLLREVQAFGLEPLDAAAKPIPAGYPIAIETVESYTHWWYQWSVLGTSKNKIAGNWEKQGKQVRDGLEKATRWLGMPLGRWCDDPEGRPWESCEPDSSE